MKLRSINPANGELLKEFEAMSFEDAAAGAKASRVSQMSWAELPLEKRAEFVAALAPALRAKALEYATLMTLEMGKPIAQAKAEVEKCALLCEFYAKSGPGFLADDVVQTEAKKSYVRFDPLGVVLCIMPWNFPFWQIFRAGVPALLGGNGVLLKHASNVPQCALAIESVFNAAGFPKGLFKTLLIDSATSGQLIEAPGLVDAVSLTGSVEAGSKVAALAGKNLKKCVLELGGNDPFIVLADADLKTAAKVAVQARMQNNGQSCIAAKRIIVEQKIAEEFEKNVLEEFKLLKMGDPMDETVNIGPLAKDEFRTGLEKQVNESVKKGAQVLAGGKSVAGKGYFFEPTLLKNLTKDMPVCREEVFGPVMSLIVVKNLDEAIALANDTEFGLGASIWTSDMKIAEACACKLNAGSVFVNGMVKSDPRLPIGGIKKSGFGRELGSYGIKEFMNIKTVVMN